MFKHILYRMRSCVHDYCMINECRYTATLTANDIVPLIIYGRELISFHPVFTKGLVIKVLKCLLSKTF